MGIGDTGINGYTLPGTLRVSSRSGNAPSSYVAGHRIDFTEGFVSGVSDGFEAYIADNSYAGTGNGGTVANTAGNGYRYGFNGEENDNEVKGEGNQQDYGFRIYDTRLGRFLSVDPLTKNYPELTPYQFASNRPIQGVDMDGLEFSNKASELAYWMKRAPLQTIIREFPQTAPQAAHQAPVIVVAGSLNAAIPKKLPERHIAEADMFGNGHIGPESMVKENIATTKQNYYAAIGQNIAGGPAGAVGYFCTSVGPTLIFGWINSCKMQG